MKHITSVVLTIGVCLFALLCGKGGSAEVLAQQEEVTDAIITQTNPKDGAEMVYVSAGEFIMGDERIQRKVYLDSFWMYKCEVTVAQYRKFCAADGRQMPAAPSFGCEENHPVVNVSWDDAQAYAKWAGVFLPTEAQWEKAARGTDSRAYPWGNELGNSNYTKLPGKPVGSYPAGASPYGCLDMAGSVWEWCKDWYDEDYHKNTLSKNPKGPLNGSARVLRGGSWLFHDSFRCSLRYFYRAPEYRSNDCGFRCAGNP